MLTDEVIRAMETAETSATGRFLTAYKIVTSLSIKDHQAIKLYDRKIRFSSGNLLMGALLKREIYRLNKSC